MGGLSSEKLRTLDRQSQNWQNNRQTIQPHTSTHSHPATCTRPSSAPPLLLLDLSFRGSLALQTLDLKEKQCEPSAKPSVPSGHTRRGLPALQPFPHLEAPPPACFHSATLPGHLLHLTARQGSTGLDHETSLENHVAMRTTGLLEARSQNLYQDQTMLHQMPPDFQQPSLPIHRTTPAVRLGVFFSQHLKIQNLNFKQDLKLFVFTSHR